MSQPMRHALITGGSQGIGLAIAQLFAQNAYRCTLISRSSAKLSSAVTTLKSSHLAAPLTHRCIAGDISSVDFWPNFQSAAGDPKDQVNRFNVLVNCAGIAQNVLFVRTRQDEIKEIVDTNLTGMMLGTQYLLKKGYIRRGDEELSPVIISVASLLGLKGGHGAVAYAASKAGVLGFTRALAEEIGSLGIRANAIVPGYISTEMTAELAESKSLLSKIPAGRFGRPEEVADAALFLARNQYANNCVLNLDGGLSAT